MKARRKYRHLRVYCPEGRSAFARAVDVTAVIVSGIGFVSAMVFLLTP